MQHELQFWKYPLGLWYIHLDIYTYKLGLRFLLVLAVKTTNDAEFGLWGKEFYCSKMNTLFLEALQSSALWDDEIEWMLMEFEDAEDGNTWLKKKYFLYWHPSK